MNYLFKFKFIKVDIYTNLNFNLNLEQVKSNKAENGVGF